MTLLRGILIVALMALPLPALAAEKSAPTPTVRDTDYGYSDLRVSVELGGAWEHYTGENKVTADAGDAIADRKHYDLDINLGLYFKPNYSNMLFGIALDILGDDWHKDPNFARVSQLLLAVTTTYFLQGQVGKGVYVHGDVGPTAFINSIGTHTGRTDQVTNTGSPLGFGLRVGAGYAFAVGDHVSLLVAANYGFRTAGASTAQPVTLTGGILF